MFNLFPCFQQQISLSLTPCVACTIRNKFFRTKQHTIFNYNIIIIKQSHSRAISFSSSQLEPSITKKKYINYIKLIFLFSAPCFIATLMSESMPKCIKCCKHSFFIPLPLLLMFWLKNVHFPSNLIIIRCNMIAIYSIPSRCYSGSKQRELKASHEKKKSELWEHEGVAISKKESHFVGILLQASVSRALKTYWLLTQSITAVFAFT